MPGEESSRKEIAAQGTGEFREKRPLDAEGAAAPLDRASGVVYIITLHMATSLLKRELKRGTTEVLILALLDERQRHGYEISQLIEERSNGTITFHTAPLYPTLYRLEDKGLIEGRWVERAGQRRRRYYRLMRAGRRALTKQRSTWDTFFLALDRIAGIRHA